MTDWLSYLTETGWISTSIARTNRLGCISLRFGCVRMWRMAHSTSDAFIHHESSKYLFGFFCVRKIKHSSRHFYRILKANHFGETSLDDTWRRNVLVLEIRFSIWPKWTKRARRVAAPQVLRDQLIKNTRTQNKSKIIQSFNSTNSISSRTICSGAHIYGMRARFSRTMAQEDGMNSSFYSFVRSAGEWSQWTSFDIPTSVIIDFCFWQICISHSHGPSFTHSGLFRININRI